MSTKTQRQLNLVLVLANARRPVSRAEIFERVPEYGQDTAVDTKVRMFERDKKELRAKYGDAISAVKTASEEDQDGYVIDMDAIMLPDIKLSPRERALITLAGSVWGNAQLAGPGHEAGFLLGRGLNNEDASALAGRSGLVGVLIEAVGQGVAVEFVYDSRRGHAVGTRVVEPWRVFCTGGAWYMVGFDLTADDGAGARRIFRLSRILSDIAVTQVAATHAAPTDLDVRELVEGWLALPSTVRTAVILVTKGSCGHLRVLADDVEELDSHDVVTITYEIEDRIARAVAAVCDKARVVSPDSLRAAVNAIVDKAVDGV